MAISTLFAFTLRLGCEVETLRLGLVLLGEGLLLLDDGLVDHGFVPLDLSIALLHLSLHLSNDALVLLEKGLVLVAEEPLGRRS